MNKTIRNGILGLACLFSFNALAENYTIGTGSQSGTYYPLGGILAKIWSENIDDFDMRAEVTAASVENTIKVAAKKQLAGIAMGNVVLQASEGVKPFPVKWMLRLYLHFIRMSFNSLYLLIQIYNLLKI
ncbi:TAXI family TRAP transporter solute-binding subunit [Psychromonas sp. KJ10-2]|uniref:TAXI family TRAP transporter solute-binding subunit n=1 Tax=Psychromonas sp. KJ10-2 TaxID=3391822 RepID=UPI0039B56D21